MIAITGAKYESFKFPAGEIQVRVSDVTPRTTIIADIKSSDDVMTLLLLIDALRRSGSFVEELIFTYLPYARQDRVAPGQKLEPSPRRHEDALEMTAHKIARILNGDPSYKDSWTDIIGYIKLINDRL